ncbi:carboxymuconolactone decarboxylase family protein [Nocardioides sp. Bht2]|uniref:carboxymuconolactone decarboxylase family protein n=1 Tax=Nocardioides sp. Bht2 TaxID=3392297 RepID=UPI0039B50272
MANRPNFLHDPTPDLEARAIFAEDYESLGFVMNLSFLWSHQPAALHGLLGLARQVAEEGGITPRQRFLIVLASSAARESKYCVLAWQRKFPGLLEPASIAGIVDGVAPIAGLEASEQALVTWVRLCVERPTATRHEDVEILRAAGYSDRQIFAVTVFAALRMAFATVNDALGAEPDDELRAAGS